MKETRPLFTIFTPVYNRGRVVHRVWESLQCQSCRDFEWVVVDDGSTDNSLDVLRRYQALADFPVTLLSQPNQGKHVAWNRGLAATRGELFVPADSDDAFVPAALERFKEIWHSIPEELRSRFSGINVLCRDPQSGEIVGDRFPRDVLDSDNLELEYIYKVRGEKWGCIRADLLRLYPFAEGTRGHLSESYVWFQLARSYRVRCVNEPLRLYYRDQPDHLAAPGRLGKLKGIETSYFFSAWHFKTNLDFLWRDQPSLARTAIAIWRLGSHLGKARSEILDDMQDRRKAGLLLLFFPAGRAAALSDRLLGRV